MNLWRNQIRTEPSIVGWHIFCPNCKKHLSSAEARCWTPEAHQYYIQEFSKLWPYLCMECSKIPEVKSQYDKVVKETEEILNERARRTGQL